MKSVRDNGYGKTGFGSELLSCKMDEKYTEMVWIYPENRC